MTAAIVFRDYFSVLPSKSSGSQKRRQGKSGKIDAIKDKTLAKKQASKPKPLKERMIDGSRCRQIDQGKVKQVYKRVLWNGDLDNSCVYYVSNKIRGPSQLRSEVRIAKDIKTRLQRVRVQECTSVTETGDIDIDLRNITQESFIQTSLTFTRDKTAVRAPCALGNLDSYLRKHTITEEQAIDIAGQIATGMHNLQKAGYVLGDAKLENLLVFKEGGRLIVRISDFGNAKLVPKGEISVLNSNDRFRSGERVLSQEGESYSTALMIAQVLGYAHRKFSEAASFTKQKKNVKRVGIEGWLLYNGRVNTKGVSGRIKNWTAYLRAKLTGTVSGTGKDDQGIIRGYLSQLQDIYCLKYRDEDRRGQRYLSLTKMFSTLKKLVDADPTKRPNLSRLILDIRSAKKPISTT